MTHENHGIRFASKLLLRGGLSAAIAMSAGAPPVAYAEEETQPRTAFELVLSPSNAEEAISYLKNVYSLVGRTDLTITESNRMLPAVATLISDTYDTAFTPDDFTRNTFIFPSEFTADDEEFIKENGVLFTLDPDAYRNSPFYKRLLQTYPNNPKIESLSGGAIFSVLQQLYQLHLMDSVLGGFDTKGQKQIERLLGVTVGKEIIFVFVNATNNYDGYRYGNNGDLTCEPSEPVVTEAITQAHEMIHYAVYAHLEDKETKVLNPAILKETSVLYEDGGKAESGYYIGFHMRLSRVNAEGKTETEAFVGLDELVTHLVASEAFTRNDQDTIAIGIKTPRVMQNFKRILTQSGISIYDLQKLHEYSQLDELLSRIAKGARGDVFSSRDEEIAFGFNLLSDLFKDKKGWEKKVADYFDVDLTDDTNLDNGSRDIPNGCVIFPETDR